MAPKKEDEEKRDSAFERFQVIDDTETSTSTSTSSSSSESDSSTSSSSSSSSSSGVEEDEEPPSSGKRKATDAKKRPTRPFLGGKASVTKTKVKKRKRKPRPLTICLSNCRYEIVRQVAKKYSLHEVGEEEAWNIYWTDFSVSLERAMDMRRYQIVNHFPGMNEICRKDLLARNLNRMRRLFPKDYDIYPKTWSLPADLGELQTYAHSRKNKTYICKPEMGCQGRGIFLVRSIKDLNPFGRIICQLYVAKPFLIDNFKFDLRIYVLITSCDPLRVYVYKEGLARFATAKYKTPTNSNTENSYMHLTNYAVNKYSRDYVIDDEEGSKRRLTAVYRWLDERGYDTNELVEAIDSVILKTIISAHPILKHNYRTCFPNHDICSACFEILGFDVLIDYKLKPCVLEVNHSPSFHTDSKLDLEIKEGLLNDALAMLNIKNLERHKVENADRKRVQDRLLNKTNPGLKKDDENSPDLSPVDKQFAHEVENSGGYRLIYPTQVSDKYDPYFEQNMSSLYQETAASQARANCTRTQIEEYNQKKLEDEKKRVVIAQKERSNSKEKVRPESPLAAEKPKIQKKVRKAEPVSSFVPSSILADEELDRMKGLLQRGMLVRSLGIEVQAFKLLCQIGTLKPEEEQVFRRMHGFTNPFGSANSKLAPNKPTYNRDIRSAGGDLYQDQLKYFHNKTSQAVPHTHAESKHCQSRAELETFSDNPQKKESWIEATSKYQESSSTGDQNKGSPRQKAEVPLHVPLNSPTRPRAGNPNSSTEAPNGSPKLRYIEEQLNSMATFIGESGSAQNKAKRHYERSLISEKLVANSMNVNNAEQGILGVSSLKPLPQVYQSDLISGIKEYTRNTSRNSAPVSKNTVGREGEPKSKLRRPPTTPKQPDKRDQVLEGLPLGTQFQRNPWASPQTVTLAQIDQSNAIGFPNPQGQAGRANLGFTGFSKKAHSSSSDMKQSLPITQMFETKNKQETRLPGFYHFRGKGSENYGRSNHHMVPANTGIAQSNNSMMLTGIRLGKTVNNSRMNLQRIEQN